MVQATDMVEMDEVAPVETGPQRTCIVTRTLQDKAAMNRAMSRTPLSRG